MKKQDPHQLLLQFNSLYKALDDVYHSLARHYGLSDCAFWILYIIKETSTCYTQSQLCEMLSLSKQTINSALKNLEAIGYIELATIMGNQKSKQIQLTAKGQHFTHQTIDKVMAMELQTFAHFSAKEQNTLFHLLGTYVKQLEEKTQAILEQPTMEE